MKARIPDFLVCPCCRGPLFHAPASAASVKGAEAELVCPRCALAFPVKDEIPMMVPHDARALAEAETLSWRQKAEALAGHAPNPQGGR